MDHTVPTRTPPVHTVKMYRAVAWVAYFNTLILPPARAHHPRSRPPASTLSDRRLSPTTTVRVRVQYTHQWARIPAPAWSIKQDFTISKDSGGSGYGVPVFVLQHYCSDDSLTTVHQRFWTLLTVRAAFASRRRRACACLMSNNTTAAVLLLRRRGFSRGALHWIGVD